MVAVLAVVLCRGASAQEPSPTAAPTPTPTAVPTLTPVATSTPTLPPGFPPEPVNVQDCAQIAAAEEDGQLVVQPGSRVEVRGVQGCAPPVGRVVVALDGRDTPIGEAVAVEDGSFVVVAQIPAGAERGPARIVVDVGRRQIVRAVHIGSPTVVVATPVPTIDAPMVALFSLLAVGLLALAAIGVSGLVRHRRRGPAPEADDTSALFEEIEPPVPAEPEPETRRGRGRREREEPPAEAAFPWDEDEAEDVPPWDEAPLQQPPPRKRAPRKKPAPRKPRAPKPPPPEIEEPVVEEPAVEEPAVEEPAPERDALSDIDELLAQPEGPPASEDVPADRRRQRSRRRDRHVWPPLEEWD